MNTAKWTRYVSACFLTLTCNWFCFVLVCFTVSRGCCGYVFMRPKIAATYLEMLHIAYSSCWLVFAFCMFHILKRLLLLSFYMRLKLETTWSKMLHMAYNLFCADTVCFAFSRGWCCFVFIKLKHVATCSELLCIAYNLIWLVLICLKIQSFLLLCFHEN